MTHKTKHELEFYLVSRVRPDVAAIIQEQLEKKFRRAFIIETEPEAEWADIVTPVKFLSSTQKHTFRFYSEALCTGMVLAMKNNIPLERII